MSTVGDERYQMAIKSLFNGVSISTRHIGQCLFVTSHRSTQFVWNKCMHGNRRTSFSISNKDKQIVHFSPPSSSSSSLWRRTRLYLCGNVFISIVSCKIKKQRKPIKNCKSTSGGDSPHWPLMHREYVVDAFHSLRWHVQIDWVCVIDEMRTNIVRVHNVATIQYSHWDVEAVRANNEEIGKM